MVWSSLKQLEPGAMWHIASLHFCDYLWWEQYAGFYSPQEPIQCKSHCLHAGSYRDQLSWAAYFREQIRIWTNLTVKQEPCTLGGKSFTTSPNREYWAGSSSKGIFFKLLLSSLGNANLDKNTYQSVIGLISASVHILGMQDANIGLNVDIKRI